MWKFGSGEGKGGDGGEKQERGMFGDMMGKMKSSAEKFTVSHSRSIGPKFRISPVDANVAPRAAAKPRAAILLKSLKVVNLGAFSTR